MLLKHRRLMMQSLVEPTEGLSQLVGKTIVAATYDEELDGAYVLAFNDGSKARFSVESSYVDFELTRQ